MKDMPIWMRIMELEMFLVPSDECQSCGTTFLAHSDKGCPQCGSRRTSSLHQVETKHEKWDMETFPVNVIDVENISNCFLPINIGDFSPYPRA